MITAWTPSCVVVNSPIETTPVAITPSSDAVLKIRTRATVKTANTPESEVVIENATHNPCRRTVGPSSESLSSHRATQFRPTHVIKQQDRERIGDHEQQQVEEQDVAFFDVVRTEIESLQRVADRRLDRSQHHSCSADDEQGQHAESHLGDR